MTRLGDVTGFAVPAIRVYQATRPASHTLAVSQGKGLTQSAAMISALLEAVELWSAERVMPDHAECPLQDLDSRHIAAWAGAQGGQCLVLDPGRKRPWVRGVDLLSGQDHLAPWDLVALDFAREPAECVSSTNGLATGNTRSEALASGVAELLEHHAIALAGQASPAEWRKRQIALDTIGDPTIRRLLGRISAAGFELRAWSLLGEVGLAVIECTMFARSHLSDDILPVTGNGCHPDARVAFLRALLETVQTQATIVAGARDDITADCYEHGRRYILEMLAATLAFGDGRLDWSSVPSTRCMTSDHCLDFLLGKAEALGGGPVIAYDHDNRHEGIHIAHVLAPRLRDDLRRNGRGAEGGDGAQIVRIAASCDARPQQTGARGEVATLAGCRTRSMQSGLIAFAGPSASGLAVPDGIEVRPPAVCGDLAELLERPPLAVALIDGCFKQAPTVWHSEIVSLLAMGTRVLGGASLGALRAAELDRFGMVGVGHIYHAYRAGILIRDDAVMLEHGPAELGYVALTVPLVDAEYALAQAGLPPAIARAMLRIVRTTPYESRDWPTCLRLYRERTGKAFPLRVGDLARAPSLKQADAAMTLESLARCEAGPVECCAPFPAVTGHFRKVLASRAPAFLASLEAPSAIGPSGKAASCIRTT